MRCWLVSRLPPWTPLSDADAAHISDAMLDDLYRQLLIVRNARIANGAISGDTLLVDPTAQAILLADYRNASASASPDRLDHDMARALAAPTGAAGSAAPVPRAAARPRSWPPGCASSSNRSYDSSWR